MNFHLTYSGTPGAITATLRNDEGTGVTETGLANSRAARAWARKTAKRIKDELTPAPVDYRTDNVFVTVSGTNGFSV